jgi:hypothetical protein
LRNEPGISNVLLIHFPVRITRINVIICECANMPI